MLTNLRLSNVDNIQHVAVQRLTLRVFGETHRIFGEFRDWLLPIIRSSAGDDGMVVQSKINLGLIQIEFHKTIVEWVKLLEAARENAAGLPFGPLVFKHNSYMSGLQEQLTGDELNAVIRLWGQRRRQALLATQNRVLGDGMNLSTRIWRLEADGYSRIQRTIASAFDGRTSAQDLANRAEHLLGVGRDLPRWTEDRLYGMTPRQRAESTYGLLRGPEFRGEGISYNALRLARTEIQFANHAVSTEIAQHSPWVTGRYTRLSPEHPEIDICDTYASGGPYPVTDEILPLHPNCMCYYKDALMTKSDFTQNVRGWLDGQNSFLDDYQAWMGLRNITEVLPPAMQLADLMDAWVSLGSSDHARLLSVH